MLDWVALNAALEAATKSSLEIVRRPYRAEDDERLLKRSFNLSIEAGKAKFPCAVPLDIDYPDHGQLKSKRKILARSLFRFNKILYIDAFCFSQKNWRTFRVDRSKSIIYDANLVFYPESENWLDYSKFNNYHDADLSVTDFFVHPNSFRDYFLPLSLIAARSRELKASDRWMFDCQFRFTSASLSKSVWGDWYSDQKAAALALTAFQIIPARLDWRKEVSRIKGGRFSRIAMMQVLDSM